MTLKSLLLPALIASALFGAPALADEAATRTVAIDRAALTTEAGAAHAYASIQTAARSACRAENRGGAGFERGVRICTADTVERTVEALNAPRLTALHERTESAIALASAD
jgi:UrcA family protein